MASHSSRIAALFLWALLGTAAADALSPGAHGFIGYGITYFAPVCAHSCSASLYVPLNCTTDDLAVLPQYRRKRDEAAEPAKPVYPSGDGWEVTNLPTTTCQSRNEFYLQTLAYCLKTHCDAQSVGDIEKWWEAELTKLPDGTGPRPYSEVLVGITEKPARPINATEPLNFTALVPEEVYHSHYVDVHGGATNEMRNSQYSLIIVVSGAVIPILMSLLRFLPWPASWVTKFHAYFIDPPLFGSKHSTPIWGLGIMPTRGQAVFVAYLWILNIVLACVGYENNSGSSYDTLSNTIKRNIANRTGVLCYALVPLVILYAGRNNFLLWLTNWSHTTFLLVHRWLAFICMMHAVLHSLVYLNIAVTSEGWEDEFTLPYWYWGCGGTIGFVVLVIKSIPAIRQRIYEIFLVAHIVIVALVIVASYKHVIIKYSEAFGFQNWLWMACVIWGFDRLVRMGRWLRHGFKRAYFTPIDEDYYRLDIPGVSADGHVYLHFPTISTWRFWENHPFSVAAVTYQAGASAPSTPIISAEKEKQVEANTAAIGSSSATDTDTDSDSVTSQRDTGIALFIRGHSGLTKSLAAKGFQPGGIPVFVEGSYNHRATFLQEDIPEPSHDFPNLLCIAGGVGITGVLPALDRFNTAGKPLGTKKLFWGSRTWPLVREVERMRGVDGGVDQSGLSERRWGDVDVTLYVGNRMDLTGLLKKELRQQVGGTVVVTCGPSTMVDEVRCAVSALARHNENGKPVVVKMMVESFTW